MPRAMEIKNDEIQCVRRLIAKGVNINQIAAKTKMSYHKVQKIVRLLDSTNPTPPTQTDLTAQRAPDTNPKSLMQMLMGDPPIERSSFGQGEGMWTPPDVARDTKTKRPLVAELHLSFA